MKGTLNNKFNEGVFFRPKYFQTSYLTGSINQMNTYEDKLQAKRIQHGVTKKVDYVYRIKDKHDKGRVKPVWSFSSKAIHGKTVLKPNVFMFTRKEECKKTFTPFFFVEPFLVYNYRNKRNQTGRKDCQAVIPY